MLVIKKLNINLWILFYNFAQTKNIVMLQSSNQSFQVQSLDTSNSSKHEEFVIRVNSSLHHPAPAKKTKHEGLQLKPILEEAIAKLDPQALNDAEWKSDQEVEFKKLNKMTLHNFCLEAEKQGKNITYTRTLTVKISD